MQPNLTLSPTCASPSFELGPMLHVTSPPSVWIVTESDESAVTVPLPVVVGGGGGGVVSSFPIATSTSFAQPNFTWSPTLKSPSCGELPFREHVTVPPSVVKPTAVDESAEIVPVPVCVDVGGGGAVTFAIAVRTPFVHASFTLSPTLKSPSFGEPSFSVHVSVPLCI